MASMPGQVKAEGCVLDLDRFFDSFGTDLLTMLLLIFFPACMTSSSFKFFLETGNNVERLMGNFSSGVGDGNLIPSQDPLKELPKMFCKVMDDKSGMTMEGFDGNWVAWDSLGMGGRKTWLTEDSFGFFLGTGVSSRIWMQ